MRIPDLRGPDLRGYVSLHRDYQFWLALSAAPICWYAMHRLEFPHRTAPLPLLTVLMVVFVSPVLEEIVFRGGLQGWLLSHQRMRSSIASISLANVISSLLFSSLHLLRQSVLWSALIFFPSLVFGWARDRHQNLLSPILLHMAYNAGHIWFFARPARREPLGASPPALHLLDELQFAFVDAPCRERSQGLWTRRYQLDGPLVPEMTYTSKHHGYAVFICSSNNLVIIA